MKLELNVHVTYKANGVSEAELRGLLQSAAEHMLDRGLITGETPAEVVECTHEVRRPIDVSPLIAALNAVAACKFKGERNMADALVMRDKWFAQVNAAIEFARAALASLPDQRTNRPALRAARRKGAL